VPQKTLALQGLSIAPSISPTAPFDRQPFWLWLGGHWLPLYLFGYAKNRVSNLRA
jgi:hypothetical protein